MYDLQHIHTQVIRQPLHFYFIRYACLYKLLDHVKNWHKEVLDKQIHLHYFPQITNLELYGSMNAQVLLDAWVLFMYAKLEPPLMTDPSFRVTN